MAAAEDRNYTAGCLALLLVAGGVLYLTSDPRAGGRRDRAAALREECIQRGKAAFQASHPATGMTRQQAGDLVAGCFAEARRNSN